MGLFKSIKLYNNVSTHVDTVANGFINSMKYEGYGVVGTKMLSGEWDISIKKGDLLRAVARKADCNEGCDNAKYSPCLC